jgi:hypothetical protein
MDLVLRRFDETPYLTPHPPNYDGPVLLTRPCNSTLDSLGIYPLLDPRTDPRANSQHAPLSELLARLDESFMDLCQLQSDFAPSGAPPNRHHGTISLFQTHLTDPTISLFSLVPAPSFAELTLNGLIKHCIDSKTAVSRACWAIHLFCFKQVAPPDLTQALAQALGPPDLTPRVVIDESYYVRLAHALFATQLLDNKRLFSFLIQRIQPRYMTLFYTYICRIFSLLKDIFRSDFKFSADYAERLRPILQTELVQLVQLAIAYEDGNKTLADLQTDETCRRARVILDLTRHPRLHHFTVYRNTFFSLFPSLDCEILIGELKQKWSVLSDAEIIDFVLIMVGSVLWFAIEAVAVAATIAATIKACLGSRPFPLNEFIDCLYENSNQIGRFSYLFAELQFQRVLNFADFLGGIYRRGFMNLRAVATLALLRALPSLDRRPAMVARICRALDALGESSADEDVLARVGGRIHENLPVCRGLPLIYRFHLGLWIVEKATDFGSACGDLVALDLSMLIPRLFARLKPKTFSMREIGALKSILPLLIARGCLESVADAVNPVDQGFARLVHKMEKRRSNPIHKIGATSRQKRKQVVSSDRIRALFSRHSHLCSLHIFDACQGIRTQREFGGILSIFLSDLLAFEGLTATTLTDFFVAFSESGCVDDPSSFFIRAMVSVLSPPMVGPILADFLASVFKTRFLQPSDFLIAMLTHNRDRSVNGLLLQLFWRVASDHMSELCVESILTEHVVKKMENSPLFTELLRSLRGFPPPIMSSDLLDRLSKSPELGAAFFSLLPDGLLQDDFNSVFEYFISHVSRATSTFWTLWLHQKPSYRATFPVAVVDRPAPREHMAALARAFTTLLFACTDATCEQTLVYVNCWTLLCLHADLVSPAMALLAADVAAGACDVLHPVAIDFLHPLLIAASEPQFDGFREALFAMRVATDRFAEFAEIAAAVFVIYVSRFARPELHPRVAVIIGGAQRLLGWIPALADAEAISLTFVVDAYNYAVAQAAQLHPVSIRQFRAELAAPADAIRPEFRRFLLETEPADQVLPLRAPVFADFKLEEPPPPRPPSPPEPPGGPDFGTLEVDDWSFGLWY